MADSIRAAAERLLSEFDALSSCSLGVAGLHQNGDVATWRELLEGGEYSHWLGDSLADLRIALAAEPPAPAEPDTDAVLSLAAIIRRVDGSNSLGAAALAEAILSHPGVAFSVLPPASGPTTDDIWELCEDHEFHLGDGFDGEASAEIMLQIIRVALTRWGRPAPAPAADGERDHVPDAGNMVAADGEREELAQWLEDEAVGHRHPPAAPRRGGGER